MLLHESLGPFEKKKKQTQHTINTLLSFLTPVTGLGKKETTMIALLLLALLPHSSALPLLSTEKDDQLFAEVRSAVSNSDVIHFCKMASADFYLTVDEK